MTRQRIIERTLNALNQLPEDKAEEISDFAVFMCMKYEEQVLSAGIRQLASNSHSFDFLNEDPEDYSISDLKEVYNG